MIPSLDKRVYTVYTVYIQYGKGRSHLQLYIDNRSDQPIYNQIYTQVKDLIIRGDLQENDPLPSIRSLAKDLRISVITTKRAYDELEREGFLYTVAGKGCFVAARNTELLREENLRKIEEHLQSCIALAASCNLTGEELVGMLRLLYEEDSPV